MKRKLAAILCADVVGYSRLVADDEEEALHRLMASREVFNTIISDMGGRIFNTAGDAILAEFTSAVEAVRAAMDIQESLRTRNLAFPPSRQMMFRIGITIGDVVEQDGDLLGDAVNIAARLETLAPTGGICLSQMVREQVSNKLTAGFRDIGMQSVKNIPQDIHAVIIEMGDEAKASPAAPGKRRFGHIGGLAAGLALIALVGLGGFFWYQKAAGPGTAKAPLQISRKAGNSLSPAGGAERPVRSTPAATPSEAIPLPGGVPKARGMMARPMPQARRRKARLQPETAEPMMQKSPEPDAASTPETVSASSAKVSPPASMRGQPFRLEDIPFIQESSREKIRKSYLNGKEFRALAINIFGDNGYSWNAKTRESAKRLALNVCKKNRNRKCEIYAVGDRIVWDHPLPVLPPRPWVPAKLPAMPFEVNALKTLSNEARLRLSREYVPAAGPKAIAVGPDGNWSYQIEGVSEDEVMRMALQFCAHRAGKMCRIAALNDLYIAP